MNVLYNFFEPFFWLVTRYSQSGTPVLLVFIYSVYIMYSRIVHDTLVRHAALTNLTLLQ